MISRGLGRITGADRWIEAKEQRSYACWQVDAMLEGPLFSYATLERLAAEVPAS